MPLPRSFAGLVWRVGAQQLPGGSMWMPGARFRPSAVPSDVSRGCCQGGACGLPTQSGSGTGDQRRPSVTFPRTGAGLISGPMASVLPGFCPSGDLVSVSQRPQWHPGSNMGLVSVPHMAGGVRASTARPSSARGRGGTAAGCGQPSLCSLGR